MNAMAYAKPLTQTDAVGTEFSWNVVYPLRSSTVQSRGWPAGECAADEFDTLCLQVDELRRELARLSDELQQTVAERDILRNAHRILSVTMSKHRARKTESTRGETDGSATSAKRAVRQRRAG